MRACLVAYSPPSSEVNLNDHCFHPSRPYEAGGGAYEQQKRLEPAEQEAWVLHHAGVDPAGPTCGGVALCRLSDDKWTTRLLKRLILPGKLVAEGAREGARYRFLPWVGGICAHVYRRSARVNQTRRPDGLSANLRES